MRGRGDVPLELPGAMRGGVLAQDSLAGASPDRVSLGVGQREWSSTSSAVLAARISRPGSKQAASLSHASEMTGTRQAAASSRRTDGAPAVSAPVSSVKRWRA
ncbi:MAG TPA: hypothetical protein VFK62_08865 [Gaiellaceae bacterium]|nr:hypothetical protein [Gaiellaceae bacterium]